jgi:hypothetical protein
MVKKLPCEITVGLTAEQGAALDRALLIQSTTVSAYGRRAVNELLLREGWLSFEQLAATSQAKA